VTAYVSRRQQTSADVSMRQHDAASSVVSARQSHARTIRDIFEEERQRYCIYSLLILLYIRPHTAIYVSSYCYICVLMLAPFESSSKRSARGTAYIVSS
jgi:hypothetical protein